MEGAKDKDGISNPMAVIMKAILKIMQQMDMANISIKQDSNTKDSGRIICLMEEEKLSTPTKAGIMEISSITNDMEKAF